MAAVAGGADERAGVSDALGPELGRARAGRRRVWLGWLAGAVGAGWAAARWRAEKPSRPGLRGLLLFLFLFFFFFFYFCFMLHTCVYESSSMLHPWYNVPW